jgi:hypothetical protein
MKKKAWLLPLLALSLAAISCMCPVSGLVNLRGEGRVVEASDTVITETREASGFDAVEMNAFGRVILEQGETESLTVSGPDNIVSLVKTTVRAGVLTISMKENIVLADPQPDDVLTFTIGFQELSGLTVSGLADVEMDGLEAGRFDLRISGAGRIDLRGLALEDLDLDLSGAGEVILAGSAASADIDLSGAGDIEAGDLEIETARVRLSGLGNATLWVTERLSGEITGVGNVEYYGDPSTDLRTPGLGHFKSLGAK